MLWNKNILLPHLNDIYNVVLPKQIFNTNSVPPCIVTNKSDKEKISIVQS